MENKNNEGKMLLDQDLEALNLQISNLRIKAEEQKSPVLKEQLKVLEKYYKARKKRADELLIVSAVGPSARFQLKAGGRFQRAGSDKVEVAQANKPCMCGSGKKFKKCCYSEMAV